MRRILVRNLTCLLMAITLVWGGGLACAQDLMPLAKVAHDCCKHGSCKSKPGTAPTSRECNLHPSNVPAATVAVVPVAPSDALALLPGLGYQVPSAIRHGRHSAMATLHIPPPPDLNLLHSLLRV